MRKKLKCKKCGNDFPISEASEIGITHCKTCYKRTPVKLVDKKEILRIMRGPF